jgi:hypothetical protein
VPAVLLRRCRIFCTREGLSSTIRPTIIGAAALPLRTACRSAAAVGLAAPQRIRLRGQCRRGPSTSRRSMHSWAPSHSLLTSSKEEATDYPSPRYSRFGNHHPQASRLRRLVAERDQQHPARRCPLRSHSLAGRQPVTHSGQLDRLERWEGHGGGRRRFPQNDWAPSLQELSSASYATTARGSLDGKRSQSTTATSKRAGTSPNR